MRFLALALGGTMVFGACTNTDEGEVDRGSTPGGGANIYPGTSGGRGAGSAGGSDAGSDVDTGGDGAGGNGGGLDAGFSGHDAGFGNHDAGFGSHDAGFVGLDAGFGELDAGFGSHDAGFVGLDAGFGSHDAGFVGLDAGFGSHDAGFVSLDAGFGTFDAGTSAEALLGEVTRQGDPGATLDRRRTGSVRPMSEAQAVALLNALNAAEIALAEAVQARLDDEESRQFAQRLTAEHTAVQERAEKHLEQAGLAPEANPVSQALDLEVRQTIAELEPLSGRELDRAWVQRQLAMHRQALSLMDCVIAPAMQDETIAGFLRETVRPALAKHQGRAAELSTWLGAGEDRELVSDEPAECSAACRAGIFDGALGAEVCVP